MLRIISATVLFTLAFGEPLPLETCGSTLGDASAAYISDVNLEDGKYIFKEDTDVEVHFVLTLHQEVKDAMMVANGIWRRTSEEYPIVDPNLSTHPLQANKEYPIQRTLKILSDYHEDEVTLQVQVFDKQSNATLACFQLPAKFVDE